MAASARKYIRILRCSARCTKDVQQQLLPERAVCVLIAGTHQTAAELTEQLRCGLAEDPVSADQALQLNFVIVWLLLLYSWASAR